MKKWIILLTILTPILLFTVYCSHDLKYDLLVCNKIHTGHIDKIDLITIDNVDPIDTRYSIWFDNGYFENIRVFIPKGVTRNSLCSLYENNGIYKFYVLESELIVPTTEEESDEIFDLLKRKIK